jgi:hypothetical protein
MGLNLTNPAQAAKVKRRGQLLGDKVPETIFLPS